MMRIFALIACAFATLAPDAAAQSERVQEMQRVVDALNSANPLVRLATLEEVFASGDNNLKRIAMQTAMESSDETLKLAAVEEAIANKNSLQVKITTFDKDKSQNILEATGGEFEVRILDFDKSTGIFKAYSSYSIRDNSGNKITREGSFSGDRISFTVNMQVAYNNSTAGWCQGAASLKSGTTVLTGTMSCGGGKLGTYGIEIDILR